MNDRPNRRLRTVSWMLLVTMVLLIVLGVSIWHQRPSRITVEASLSVTARGEEFAALEVFLQGKSVEKAPPQGVEINPLDERYQPLQPGWQTADLIEIGLAQLGDPNRLNVALTHRRSPSEPLGGWADGAWVLFERTRNDSTIEPVVIAGWRILEHNFAMVVTFTGAWRPSPPQVQISLHGQDLPKSGSWLDDRLTLTRELRIELFYRSNR
ncbi:MAG: hypothetical protein AAF488_07240 [Planctomycetota bacterium]